ncbi:DNA cytosine methyltransferase [Proteus sp. FME41]|uniref:DNA cytosine methyltransferase n=1 Tax=Proteus sp. FME41 TaxID=2742608 RepID=UPI0018696AFC|nr:DNA cytosine methyltransferase [Proteus sp. FME41]
MLCNLKNNKKSYIDLFSGCGGLSLGLGKAGWEGVFAAEKDEMAFKTFAHNLIENETSHFNWPKWLPKEATTIQDLISNYSKELLQLKGRVDLIAGGPPCQGFSLAGRRNVKDPRNMLFNEYLKMVKIIEPKYVLLENVRGFNSSFKPSHGEKARQPYSMIVKKKLQKLGYIVYFDFVCSAKFGVPQNRTRFIMIGIKKNKINKEMNNPFELLANLRVDFLRENKLPLEPIKVSDAIDDLLLSKNNIIYHSGTKEKGFKKIDYAIPDEQSLYLKYLRKGDERKKPNSLRLARHKAKTIEKFKLIQSICKPGISLDDEMRLLVGTKKQAITVLNANEPSKTLTTLPDDLLHYSEPRILTVREMARIQSFPDSFDILGKYTTGGTRRTQECPRYTQVGNAVPPLLGEALGYLIKKIDSTIKG